MASEVRRAAGPDPDPAAGDPLRGEVSALLIELYRGSRSQPVEAFCTWALGRVRRLVPFDSAMWGHGASHPVVQLHDVHLVDQPAAMLENYARVQQDDFLAKAVGERMGSTVELYSIITREAFVATRMYRLHARRFGMENLLCTGLPDTGSGLMSVVSFWRADAGRRFTEAERALKQFLMPHLVEARRLNVFQAIRARLAPPEPARVEAAVCDRRGNLHEAEPEFVALLRTAWPDWSGPVLPEPLRRAIGAGRVAALQSGGLQFAWSPLERRLVLSVRPHSTVDTLTRRERDVALMLAEGGSAKEIARQLRVEVNTVRSHGYAVYRKLDVRNRAQLTRALVAAGVVRPA